MFWVLERIRSYSHLKFFGKFHSLNEFPLYQKSWTVTAAVLLRYSTRALRPEFDFCRPTPKKRRNRGARKLLGRITTPTDGSGGGLRQSESAVGENHWSNRRQWWQASTIRVSHRISHFLSGLRLRQGTSLAVSPRRLLRSTHNSRWTTSRPRIAATRWRPSCQKQSSSPTRPQHNRRSLCAFRFLRAYPRARCSSFHYPGGP